MSTHLLLTAGSVFLLLFLMAIFSASETALTVSSKARLHRLAEGGSPRARLVLKLRADPERLIGGLLLAVTVVNTLATALATKFFLEVAGPRGVEISTAVMSVLVFVFAEVLPKTYAISMPDRAALVVAPLIGALVRVSAPLLKGFQALVRALLKFLGIDTSASGHALSAQEEIRGTIDIQAWEGGIIKADKDMLGAVLDLDQVTVEDVMIHRKHMLMICADDRPADIVAQVVRAPYTRLPLWKGEPENIIGVLHAKSVLAAMRDPGSRISGIDFESIMTPPWFVPETTTLREQLNAFLSKHAHFALVVDEYGTLRGMVTLEDILEEIVGDISDEHDVKVEGVTEAPDGGWIIDGKVTLRDLNRRFGWNLPDDEATTIAGLVIYAAERLPIAGETVAAHGMIFEVLGRRRNQITRLKVRKAQA